jgi:pentatricopeptide repeat protein
MIMDKKLKPTEETARKVLRTFAEAGLPEEAYKVLQVMEKERYP